MARQKNTVRDLSELDWHRVSIDEALRRLAIAPKTGLDAAQVQRRTAQYGANQIWPPPKRELRKAIGWVFGGFGSLLLAVSVLCFVACPFNAWQDFSTSRVMDSIEGMLPADLVVLRDGVQTILPAASLVPGDIVHLNMGQKVPADVKLIDVSGNLRFDRSVLTGERADRRTFRQANDTSCSLQLRPARNAKDAHIVYYLTCFQVF